MAHGFSAVKEMFRLSKYAERFEEAGFVTLVFDSDFLVLATESHADKLFPMNNKTIIATRLHGCLDSRRLMKTVSVCVALHTAGVMCFI